ncbi:MAG TPA: DUF4097 family beta strand repeat-containing protein [Trebonia sp.]
MAATTAPLRMTGGRRVALAIGVPVCLALVAGTGLGVIGDFGVGTYQVSKVVPATTTALAVNVIGQLTIEPTKARQATLAGTAKYSIIRPAVTERTSDGTTTFGYGCSFPAGECGLDATVAVPATVTTLTASSGGGNASVTGTTGPVTLSTGSGNLSVSHASGPVTLSTDSGSIQVSDTRSDALIASSGSGNIGISTAGATSATITASTDSGSISGNAITTNEITAASGNGNITITFKTVPDNVRVNTDSGNIVIKLPAGSTAYNVTPTTDSGHVIDGTVPRSGNSAHVITASTGSGNITITR